MTELESPAPRQRSGRAARAAARSGNGRRSGPSFIRREIPTFDLLSEEGLDLVEQHADRLLADVGIEIRDDEESLRTLLTTQERNWARDEDVNDSARIYLNRLSDFLFVLARALNVAAGGGDVLWKRDRKTPG